MSIPRSFIDDLLSRSDIVEIISSRVHLRKAGSNFVAPCPFHTEKTPSFTVSPAKQFFYCFGCGAHGDAIQFVMQFDRLDFFDAVTSLAAHLGLEVPKDSYSDINKDQIIENKSSYGLLNKVSLFYQEQLTRFEKAKNYLNSRKVSDEICKRFLIGYAPSSYRNELLVLMPNVLPLLVSNGILIKKDNNDIYERFRDRIMFPIRNVKGQIIAFGGRVLGDGQPKYLNSPETSLFHKSDELYGLYEARHSNQKLEKIVVVEGYMDVIALAQYGISFAVATMGTAITVKHIQKLFRETSDIIFCFDGDLAGKNAAWRALEITLPLMRDGVRVRFLFLPETEDPDSFIRKAGQTAFFRCLDEAVLLSDFFFDHLSTSVDIVTIDNQAILVKKAKTLLDNMPNGVFKEMLWQKLAKLVHMDVITLKQASVLKNERTITEQPKQQNEVVLERLITLLLHYPELAKNIDNLENLTKLDKLNLPYMDIFMWLVYLLRDNPYIVSSEILERCKTEEDTNFFARLLVSVPLISKDSLKSEFLGIINKLYMRTDEDMIASFMQKARKENLTTEEKLILQDLIKKTKY